MTKQTVQIRVSIPEGYEATGEYRIVEMGETYLDCYGEAKVRTTDVPYGLSCIILRKKPLCGSAWIATLPNYTAFRIKNCWPIYQIIDGNLKSTYDDFCEYLLATCSDDTCEIL